MQSTKSCSARTGVYMGHRRGTQLHIALLVCTQPPYFPGWVANMRMRGERDDKAMRKKRPAPTSHILTMYTYTRS